MKSNRHFVKGKVAIGCAGIHLPTISGRGFFGTTTIFNRLSKDSNFPKTMNSPTISSPSSGGAIGGLGEKFSPNLFTGTGNFSVPISLPQLRSSAPTFSLGYSTGSGNGVFGLGWSLGAPSIGRSTAKKIPRYDDRQDTFLLAGAEDLVPVEQGAGFVRYRPRTEGLFAKIYHRQPPTGLDFWEVRSKNGSVQWFGDMDGNHPNAHYKKPGGGIFSWLLRRTQDALNNIVEYDYEYHGDAMGGQVYLKTVHYGCYGSVASPQFAFRVDFFYENRPDPFTSAKAGFVSKTLLRCTRMEVYNLLLPMGSTLVKSFDFQYLDQRVALGEQPSTKLPPNGASLLSRVKTMGHDGNDTEEMAPLDFDYTPFELSKRRFKTLQGAPASALNAPGMEVADLFGDGLPCFVELGGDIARYWRNRGDGVFDAPRPLPNAPAGLSLQNAEVVLMDVNGNARPDLVVHRPGLSGFFPARFGGSWDKDAFQKYKTAPSFSLQDPEVKMLDLDGDGISDAIRARGDRFECYYYDHQNAWESVDVVQRRSGDELSTLSLAAEGVHICDLSGDGLQDIAWVRNGNICYWQNLGYGQFAAKTIMRNSPRLPEGYDPRRVLLTDVDGDGIADLIFVENNRVTVWFNQSGQGWSDAYVIEGTPAVTDFDSLRTLDLLGTGTDGILWSTDGRGDGNYHFLDIAGGQKPYLLQEMRNNMGSLTRVEYAPSTQHFLRDAARPATRWKSHLPFPVQTVTRSETIDLIGGSKRSTEYRYHHGHWDGGEREFKGFGRVDTLDTETFFEYNAGGLHGTVAFTQIPRAHYAPPVETRTWFHLGPVGDEFGEWEEADFSDEYWQGDAPALRRPAACLQMLRSLPRRARRDALRTMSGSQLRSEVYALDGSPLAQRPFTVSEQQYTVRLESSPSVQSPQGYFLPGSGYVFFTTGAGGRNTNWERGNDPHSAFALPVGHDAYGQSLGELSIAVPRGRDFRNPFAQAAEPYLATMGLTRYIDPVDTPQQYLTELVCASKVYEIINDGTEDIFTFYENILSAAVPAQAYHLVSQQFTLYDGNAFQGLPLGQVGPYGVAVRSEQLILTEDIIQNAYTCPDGDRRPYYFQNQAPTAEYPSEFIGQLAPSAGYIFRNDPQLATGYYEVTQQAKFDFHINPLDFRGVLLETKDALGYVSSIEYDAYGLPIRTVDHLGMSVTCVNDYRVLKPFETTDINGNRCQARFSPMGMVTAIATMGKTNEAVGDTLAAPGKMMEYDFLAWYLRGQPCWVKTTLREEHVSQNPQARTQVSVVYSDGFGRVIQSRAQAEDILYGNNATGESGIAVTAGTLDGPAQGNLGMAGSRPRVVVSGWKVENNKGMTVETYEPFFDWGFDYNPSQNAGYGEKTTYFYDGLGRKVRTVHPDGGEKRTVYGRPRRLDTPDDFEPSPWEVYVYDVNDLKPLTHPNDHTVPAHHCFTPVSQTMDALGRNVRSVSRNAVPGGPTEELVMAYRFDIRGNMLEIVDPSGRLAFKNIYDLSADKDGKSRVLQSWHLDSGAKTAVFDGLGQEIESRDSKGALNLSTYDALGRRKSLWARDQAQEAVTKRIFNIYGDEQHHFQANNLGRRIWKQYDEAGLTQNDAYDFKGNLLRSGRRMFNDDTLIRGGFRADWTGDLALLESQVLDPQHYYESQTEYDALNRPVALTLPVDTQGNRSIVKTQYNKGGFLEKLLLDGNEFVHKIAYNVRGQRILAAYGNGLMTRYCYDAKGGQLVRLKTEGYTTQGLRFEPVAGSVRQDYGYAYDLAGNVVALLDRTPQCGILNSPEGSDALTRQYTYDALYRLLSATGRETAQATGAAEWQDNAPAFDPGSMPGPAITAAYTQEYAYDRLGNILTLRHIAAQTQHSYTRTFGYGDTNAQGVALNRLSASSVGSQQPITTRYRYDACGNLTQEASNRFFEWDYANRLRRFHDTAGNTTTVDACYLYDAAGNRLKKLVQKQGGRTEVTVYIGGGFEHSYIKQSGSVVAENNLLHLSDGPRKMATVRRGDSLSSQLNPNLPQAPAVQYHLDDHLGSCAATMDEQGNYINREEYYPFGGTAFGSFSEKRYRFCGKEKDEESGLYYYGMRYYAPWLCRFVSVDPLAEPYAHYTPYQYAGNQPIVASDLDGAEPDRKVFKVETERFVSPTMAVGTDVFTNEQIDNILQDYDEVVQVHTSTVKDMDGNVVTTTQTITTTRYMRNVDKHGYGFAIASNFMNWNPVANISSAVGNINLDPENMGKGMTTGQRWGKGIQGVIGIATMGYGGACATGIAKVGITKGLTAELTMSAAEEFSIQYTSQIALGEGFNPVTAAGKMNLVGVAIGAVDPGDSHLADYFLNVGLSSAFEYSVSDGVSLVGYNKSTTDFMVDFSFNGLTHTASKFGDYVASNGDKGWDHDKFSKHFAYATGRVGLNGTINVGGGFFANMTKEALKGDEKKDDNK